MEYICNVFLLRTKTLIFLVLEHAYLTFGKLILYSIHPSVVFYENATNAPKWILPTDIKPFLLI